MSVFTGGPYGRQAVMLNTCTLSSLNIEIIIIIISFHWICLAKRALQKFESRRFVGNGRYIHDNRRTVPPVLSKRQGEIAKSLA